ncbi:MAG: hypothetical protein NVSMB9_20880 [Isosphaeraceae bacterium]
MFPLGILLVASGFAFTDSPRAASSQPKTARDNRIAYYMVVFAAEDDHHSALTSHCFATFAKIQTGYGGTTGPVLELRHINWFTRRGHETGMTRGVLDELGQPVPPEPGENRDTRSAFRSAARRGLTIYRWGPYEIRAELYRRACRQVAILEGRDPHHKILYKAEDLGFRDGPRATALNCVHAISDLDRDHGPLRTGPAFGKEAGRLVVDHLKRWIKESARVDSGVWNRIWNGHTETSVKTLQQDLPL